MKGYPKSADDVTAYISRAEAENFEFICVQASKISAKQVTEAAERGVWFLTWDHVRQNNVAHWRALAEAGMGGLIVDNPVLASTEAAPRFKSICSPPTN